MTVPSTGRRSGPYMTNGSTTDFAYTFPIWEDAELKVYRKTTDTGEEILLTLDSDYVVTGAGDVGGGSVVIDPSLPSGYEITIKGSVDQDQTTDLENNSPFHPDVIEQALDKLTKISIDLQEQINRCVKFPVSDDGIDTETPSSSLRANMMAIYDATGKPSVGALLSGTMVGTANIVDASITYSKLSASLAALVDRDQVVYVTDYGATGDGATDDSATIQNAISACSGKTLYFPPGTYLISSITITVEMDLLLHPQAILKKKSGLASTSAIVVDHDDVTITGGQFDGNRVNDTSMAYPDTGIYINEKDRVTVRGMWFYEHARHGVGSYHSCDDITVRDCKFEGCLTAFGLRDDFQISKPVSSGSKRILFQGNFIDFTAESATTYAGRGFGIGSIGGTCYDVRTIDNVILFPETTNGTLDTLLIEMWAAHERCIVRGNYCQGGTCSISVPDADYSLTSENLCISPLKQGIEYGGNKAVLSSNIIVDADYCLTGTSKDSTIDGNVMVNGTYGVFTSNTDYTKMRYRCVVSNNVIVDVDKAIYMENQSTGTPTADIGVVITGNSVSQTSLVAGTHALRLDGLQGVSITANAFKNYEKVLYLVSDSTNIVMTGNIVSGCTTFISSLGARATFTGLVSQGNTGDLAEAKYEYLDWGSDIKRLIGTGTPEAVVTAGVGSVFMRTDGGTGTTMYVKESGTGNTGWAAM